MKQIVLIIFLLTICSYAQAQEMKGMGMPKKQKQPVTYTCPMHPEIHATKPGNCPKCGMKLVKEKPADKVSSRRAYTNDGQLKGNGQYLRYGYAQSKPGIHKNNGQ